MPECVGDLGYDVSSVRRIYNIIIAIPGVEHAKTVVVFGSKDHILHAGLPGQSGPQGGIEVHGIKCLGQGVVFINSNDYLMALL